MIRGFLVRYLRRKQAAYVAALVAAGALDAGVDGADRDGFGAALAAVSAAALAAAKIPADSTAWTRLKAKGVYISSFGQLTVDRQRAVDAFVGAALARTASPPCPRKARKRFSRIAAAALAEAKAADPDAPPPPPAETDAGLLEEFVAYEHAHPGRVFRDDPALHDRLVMAALLSPEFRVLKRSVIEQFTDHRYVATSVETNHGISDRTDKP